MGRAQELDDCHELPSTAVPDLQEWDPFDVLGREPDLRRGFQQPEGGLANRRGLRPGHGEIGPAERATWLRRQVVDVDVLLELNDVVRRDPGGQLPAQRREELRVEVLPVGCLLEVGVHTREG